MAAKSTRWWCATDTSFAIEATEKGKFFQNGTSVTAKEQALELEKLERALKNN